MDHLVKEHISVFTLLELTPGPTCQCISVPGSKFCKPCISGTGYGTKIYSLHHFYLPYKLSKFCLFHEENSDLIISSELQWNGHASVRDASHLRKVSLFCLGCALDLLLGREPSKRKEPYDLAKEEGVGKPSLSKKRVQIPKGPVTTISKGSQGPGTSDNNQDF